MELLVISYVREIYIRHFLCLEGSAFHDLERRENWQHISYDGNISLFKNPTLQSSLFAKKTLSTREAEIIVVSRRNCYSRGIMNKVLPAEENNVEKCYAMGKKFHEIKACSFYNLQLA